MRFVYVVVSIALFLAWGAPVQAQRAPLAEGERSWCEMRSASDGGIAACTRWDPRGPSGRRSTVQLHWLDADLRPTGTKTQLHDGKAMLISLAAQPGMACVTLLHGGAVPRVVVALAPRTGAPPKSIEVPRTAGADFAPTNSATCARPGGFALIWQERSRVNPSEIRTFFGQLDLQGRWVRSPSEVPVMWGFGALAWNGKGYHLALFYDGAAYGQTRLSMVTLSELGQPEQHPWWVSPPEAIGDTQMFLTAGGMMAVWRGGTDESSLHSTIVGRGGQWGVEASAPRSNGTTSDRQMFAVRSKPDGTSEVVVRAAPQ